MELKFAAFALIHDERDRFLWKLRGDMRLLDLPGGCCEESDLVTGRKYDETCLFREVMEETGLEIKILGQVGLYFTEAVRYSTQSISATYWCQKIGGELRENDEALSFGWFRTNELPENAFQLHRRMVEDFPLWSATLSKQGRLIGGDLRGMVDVHRRALL